MACSSRPAVARPGSDFETDPAERLAEILGLIADIAELPTASTTDHAADATDLPPGLLDALSMCQVRHRAAH